jgi:L-asparagine transporter-like permease
MRPDAVALAALVILLLPMGYFLLASPAFLLVKLDIPPVTQLLRGMFNIQFRMVSVAGVIGTVAFLVAGRPLFAAGIGLIAALAIWGRPWFMRQMDDQLSARDAGDTGAVRRLRRLHWSAMLCNAALVAALVASIPYVATST